MKGDKIIYQEIIDPKYKTMILDGINRDAQQKIGLGTGNGSFSFVLKGEDGDFEGGISGFYYYGCFFIDLLYVSEHARGKGFGRQLMQKAEDLAKQSDCLFIALNTMDFEARPFYEKLGYKLEFTREGFKKGTKLYMMRKSLNSSHS